MNFIQLQKYNRVNYIFDRNQCNNKGKIVFERQEDNFEVGFCFLNNS